MSNLITTGRAKSNFISIFCNLNANGSGDLLNSGYVVRLLLWMRLKVGLFGMDTILHAYLHIKIMRQYARGIMFDSAKLLYVGLV